MKNKEPLKVGDRVAVYGHKTSSSRIECAVLGIYPEKSLRLTEDGVDYFTAHPKQCRRLVKKPKQEFWVAELPDGKMSAWLNKTVALYNCLNAQKLYRVRVIEELEI